jgi:flagellar motor switch protein FliG
MLDRGNGAKPSIKRDEFLEVGQVLAKMDGEMVAKIIGSIVWTKKDLTLAVNLILSFQSDVGAAAVLDLSALKTAERILVSMNVAKAFTLLSFMKKTVQNEEYLSLALTRLGSLEIGIAAAILDQAPPELGMKLFASLGPARALELLTNMKATPNNQQYIRLALERFGKIEPDLSASILDTATTDIAAKIIDSMGPARACTVLAKMAPSKASAVLSNVQEGRKEKYLQGIHDEQREKIELCFSSGHKRVRETNDDAGCCKRRRGNPDEIDID